MRYQRTMQDLALLVLRVMLGGYMLLAGLGKAQAELDKENGFGHFYNTSFKGMQPDWLPTWFAQPYGYALPWLELIVGGLLILGLFTRVTAFIGLGMLVSFTIALAMKFGRIEAQPEGPGGPFNANYIQSACYLLLFLVGAGRVSVDVLLFGSPKKG